MANDGRVIENEESGDDRWWVGIRPCPRKRDVYVDQPYEQSGLTILACQVSFASPNALRF